MTIYRDNLPVILIDRHIGNDAVYGPGITGADFVRELNFIENSGHTECEVWVSTVGGSVMDGMEIYNAIANSKINVNTRNVGVAASTGGWLLQAGKKRICNYYAQLMMHNTSGGDDKALNALNGSIISMLSVRCKKSDNWIKDRMEEEVWINAEDGFKKYELYDEVDYNCGIEVKDAFENKSPFAAYNQLRLVVNKLIEVPKKYNMKKINNSLKLDENASEDLAVREIETLNETIKTLTNSVKEKQDALDLIKSDSEKAAKDAAATAVVDAAIKEGRIDNSAKDGFVALAKKDLEGVKNTLAKMPVRSVANKIPLGTGVDESRNSWTYSDWEKKDPKGLTEIYKNSREQYDSMLEKHKLQKTK